MRVISMRLPVTVLIMGLLVTGCGEYAAKGAGEGATIGAASGAVGGLISALVFGGDPAEAAARGAVYGGAVGATTGAISGSRVDAKIDEQRQAKEEEIRNEIGDEAFKGLSALMNCDHDDALQDAIIAKQSQNPNFAVAGYWLEILSYADQGDISKTNELLPGVVEKDWDISTESMARANLLDLRDRLGDIREEYSLPAKCN